MKKEIETVYYEMPYYLEPEKSGGKAYILLRDALKKIWQSRFGKFCIEKQRKPLPDKALQQFTYCP